MTPDSCAGPGAMASVGLAWKCGGRAAGWPRTSPSAHVLAPCWALSLAGQAPAQHRGGHVPYTNGGSAHSWGAARGPQRRPQTPVPGGSWVWWSPVGGAFSPMLKVKNRPLGAQGRGNGAAGLLEGHLHATAGPTPPPLGLWTVLSSSGLRCPVWREEKGSVQ